MSEPTARDADFVEFVSASWARLVRAAVMLGSEYHEAEDVVQTTLVKCYANWRRVQRADNPDAYVFGIMINSLKSMKRKRSSSELPSGHLFKDTLPNDGADLELVAAVQRSLNQLSDDARRVIVLRYVADLPEAQISQLLHIPQGTVKRRLHRAMKELARDTTLADFRS